MGSIGGDGGDIPLIGMTISGSRRGCGSDGMAEGGGAEAMGVPM